METRAIHDIETLGGGVKNSAKNADVLMYKDYLKNEGSLKKNKYAEVMPTFYPFIR